MPKPRSSSRTTLMRLVVFALLGWVLVYLRRSLPIAGSQEGHGGHEPTRASERDRVAAQPRARRRKRFATSLAFATLFFAGAALSAGAGDVIVGAIEGTTTTQATTGETDPGSGSGAPASEPVSDGDSGAVPAEEIPPPEEPADDPVAAPEEPEAPDGDAADPGAPEAPGGDAADPDTPPTETAPEGPEAPADPGSEDSPANEGTPPSGDAPDSGAAPASPPPSPPAVAPAPVGPPLVQPHEHEHDEAVRQLDPEADAAESYATVWLHRTLPDPTPRARRVAPAFARMLRQEARRARVDWALVLAAFRADGRGGRNPAHRAGVRSVATRLKALLGSGEWQAFLAFGGRTAYADRAMALTRYNRAVGLRALVIGLDAAKKRLANAVLADRRLDIYAGGRADIAAWRIDVRVLVLLRYLAEAHGQVTVTSLQSGHRLYARPGVISAHVYGLAADIAALGGKPILGNSAPGGLAEQAVRNILLLPAELRPRQVISLLGLGGPSFPLANHADHIHVGY